MPGARRFTPVAPYNNAILQRPLKAKRSIDYRRGVVIILDALKLEEEACERYRTVRDHLQRCASPAADWVA